MSESKRLSLADLAEKSTDTKIQTAGALNGEQNPFLKMVRESYEADVRLTDSGWKEVPMPSTMLDDAITSLRGLSTWFGKVGEPIGVHIRVEYQPDDANGTVEVGPKDFEEIPRDGREVFLKYTGRTRLLRGRKSKRQTDAAQVPDSMESSGAGDLAPDVEDDDSELVAAE